MRKELQKYLKRGRRAEGACADVLGNTTLVNKFAQFWKEQGDDLMLVSAVKLHEYELSTDYTKEEMQAYKKGLADLALFFNQCWLEIEAERLKREKLAGAETSVI